MQEAGGALWRSTLERIMRYANADPTTNMIALRQAAFDAKRLLAAGGPYVRVEELEAEQESLHGRIATLEAEIARLNQAKGMPYGDTKRRGPGRPRKLVAGPA